jgi:tRNA U55 pseudouridine synthase TruB
MVHLQRCQVGPFYLKSAYTLDLLQQRAMEGTLHRTLIPLADALDFLPTLSVTVQQYHELQRGQGRALPAVLTTMPGLPQCQAACYRLWIQPQGTFAVMHRRSSTPVGWRLRYLETSHSTHCVPRLKEGEQCPC